MTTTPPTSIVVRSDNRDLFLWPRMLQPVTIGSVVTSETTKRVLHTLANCLSEDGSSVVSGLRILDGWGHIVLVRIHTPLSWTAHHEVVVRLKEAVEEALEDQRHRVEIVWDSGG